MDGIKLLSFLVLLSNIIFILVVFIFALSKVTKNKKTSRNLYDFLTKHSFRLIVSVSFVATFGSLYLSEIRHLTPCLLCWYQRIFMYPTTVLLMTERFVKTQKVHLFLLPLSFIGGLIAIYHYSLQVTPNPYAPCATLGYSVSCSERFVTNFGYITIPWMSFSAFVIIFFLSLIKLKLKKIERLINS
ncbi:MAG TPA: disulfide bond formation protein B [Patescibacteria group bacterium]|nr:disulfide bond formation protein B [Patescibacteria group bacterium]